MTGPISNQGPLTNGKQNSLQDSKSPRAKGSSEGGGNQAPSQATTLSVDAVKLNSLAGGISSSEEASRVASSLRQSFASQGGLALAAFGNAGNARAMQNLAGE